ncbi:MAG: hypothetical protein JKY60_07660 [Kordiimonadaceae bacterium]|nr:hypothetical protein [Kordiimonadaceae bacterium]
MLILLLFLAPDAAPARAIVQPAIQFQGPVIVTFPRAYLASRGGVYCGGYFDIFRELIEEARFEPKFITMPMARIYSSIRNGESHFHMWMAGRDFNSISEQTLLVEPSVFPVIRISLYALVGTQNPVVDDLRDVTIITVLGYEFSGFLDTLKARPNVKFLYANNQASAVKMLKAGRAPYLLSAHARMDLKNLEIEHTELTETVLLARQIYATVLKSAPNHKDLHARLEAASKRIVARHAQGIQEKTSCEDG